MMTEVKYPWVVVVVGSGGYAAALNQEIYARMIQRSIEKRRIDGYENE